MKVRSELWQNADFIRVWMAETVSVFGSQFYLLAMPLTAVIVLEATASELGLLFAVEMLPFLLFGLIVGVWADRLRRRSIMIVCDIARAVVLAAIPVTWYFDLLSWPVVFAVAFVAGAFTAFFDITYQAYLPILVKRSQLIDANSKLETSRSSSQVAGPSIAGIAVDAVGAPLAMAVNSLSFIGSALFLIRVKKQESVVPKERRRSTFSEIKEGIAIVFSNKLLRSIAGCTSTANLFGSMTFAILMLFMVEELDLSSSWIGATFAVGALGAVVGALTSSKLTSVLGLGRAVVIAAFLSGLPLMAIVLAEPSNAVVVMMVIMFVNGYLMVLYNVNQISLRQSITPDHLQGKMNATMRFLVWGVFPIGGILGGVLGDAIGLRTTILISGVGVALSFLWVQLSPVAKVRGLSEQDDVPVAC